MSQKAIIARVLVHGHPYIGRVNGADCAIRSIIRPILRLIVVDAAGGLKRNLHDESISSW